VRVKHFILVFSGFLTLGACGGRPSSSPPDAGGIEKPQCNYNGAMYSPGDIFCAIDGCNSCRCDSNGAVSCSLKKCLAPGDVADVCRSGSGQLPDCPRERNGDLALETGDQCPAGFTACLSTSVACDEYIRCECVNGKISCRADPAADGESCSEVKPGKSCIHEPSTANEQTLYCTCTGGTWSCKTETCPAQKPDDGSQCDKHYLLTCHYFYRESRCDYLDLFWHCRCEDGQWDCWDDKEDCFFGDASTPDGGA